MVEVAVVLSDLLRSPCLLPLGAAHLVSEVSLDRSLLEVRTSGHLPGQGHDKWDLCGRQEEFGKWYGNFEETTSEEGGCSANA